MTTSTKGRNPNRTATGKKNKFRNFAVFVTEDGRFVGSEFEGPKKKVADSRKEFRRRCELVAECQAGLIHLLEIQKPFTLHGVDGSVICRFVADFVYVRNGKRIVEDVKPMRKVRGKDRQWVRDSFGEFVLKPFATPVYFLKKKLMWAEYRIRVVEF